MNRLKGAEGRRRETITTRTLVFKSSSNSTICQTGRDETGSEREAAHDRGDTREVSKESVAPETVDSWHGSQTRAAGRERNTSPLTRKHRVRLSEILRVPQQPAGFFESGTGRSGPALWAKWLTNRSSRSIFTDKNLPGAPDSGSPSPPGIATYPFDALDFDGMVRSADEALYKSKFLGKNRIYDYLEKENIGEPGGRGGTPQVHPRYQVTAGTAR